MGRSKHRGVPMGAAAARQAGREEGVSLATAILLMAMLDGGYLTPEQMPGAWEKVNYLSDSIAKGYVNAADMRKTLREEYGIRL